MSGGKQTAQPTSGYTIIEVMIFLAISGMMFVMAAVFISGKVAKTQFRDGMNQLASTLQTYINESASGRFPDTASFNCSAGANFLTFSPGNSAQGTHDDCVFLGYMLQFHPAVNAASPGISNSTTQFNAFTIAGSRAGTDNLNPSLPAQTLLNNTTPTAVTLTPNSSFFPVVENTAYSLPITKVWVNYSGTFKPADGFGFITQFAQSGSGSNVNGGTIVSLADYNASFGGTPTTGVTTKVAANAINSTLSSGTNYLQYAPAGQAVICVNDGAGRIASVSVGSQGSQLAATVHIGQIAGVTC
ncbi:MAG TPA: hypothetical protein VG992_01200 [Candidatus Saccharimonadales bacterium]|nr:hypothetical protein [Candidatus Saccharimonadales bacterium]